ncbi:hypothetical protein [Paenibacillus darwinianus]|uniref:hypothetical protein n=1 Tax=Paenibacillus darwinianus TaxID=1380763 RepID=UPI00068A51B0|nr:hypothetical protein [Paenibacillus darwinianus]
MEDELTNAVGGTVTIQIRNNTVGKFGVRHNPIETRNGAIGEAGKGMSAEQVLSFRRMAVEALRLKRSWTHGEILYDFAVRSGKDGWSASVLYESNYNSAAWPYRYQPKQPAVKGNQFA